MTFDVGAAPEIIKNGVTGYVIKDGDHSGFKRCVIELLTNPALATKMGKIGQGRTLNLFSMDRKIERFLSIMEQDFITIKHTTRAYTWQDSSL